MIPTNLQKDAVNRILLEYNNKKHKTVEFKAPTGSGKTLMATYFISSLLENNLDKRFIFVIATPSQAMLPEAFANKINSYKKYLPYNNFGCEYIESPSSGKNAKLERTPSIKVETSKVYIFGKSTFGKGRIYTELGVIDNFIDEIINTNHELIYIRDEAHIGDIRQDASEKEFEKLIQSKASFIIKMTATPSYSFDSVLVELKEKDLNDSSLNDGKFLLKSDHRIMVDRNIDEDTLLNSAINEFKIIKQEYLNNLYSKNKVLIKPALLIQVSDEPSDKFKKIEFFNELNRIKEELNNHNLSWVKYFGKNDTETSTLNKNFTLEEIAKNDSDIDCIIFKVGPATGWDIPRACMLLQLRKVCSDKLTVQTLGRIKRNPMPELVFNDITNKFYLYSNNIDNSKDLNYYKYELKNTFIDEEFPIIEIVNKSKISKSLFKETKDCKIYNFLKDNKDQIMSDLPYLFGYDSFNNTLYFKKISNIVGDNLVYRKITNVFMFLYEIEMTKINKAKYYSHLQKPINLAYNDIFSKLEIKINNTKFKINKEYLEYLLLNSKFSYFNKLTKLLYESMQYRPEYQVKLVKYNPKEFKEIDYVNNRIEEFLTNKTYSDNYLFETIKNDDESKNNVVMLDSKPEKIVYNYIKEKILEYSKGKINIKLWGKNFKQSTIKGEYLDKEFSLHTSYWDFILKFSNNVSLYIEVKSENDINPEKTILLENAYSDYFKNPLKDMFVMDRESKEPFIISIWKVNTNNINKIKVTNFYDKEIFSNLDISDSNPDNLIDCIINFEPLKKIG